MANKTHHYNSKRAASMKELVKEKHYKYYMAAVNYLSRGMKRLPWNEELFLCRLVEMMASDIDNHIEYAEEFLKKNNIPCPAKDYRERIALEYSTIYFHFVVESLSNAKLLAKSELTVPICDAFLSRFQQFDTMLEDYGLGTLWLMYQKRSLDMIELMSDHKEKLVDINNEMNFRRIFITEPFANINFLQPTKVDPDLTRVIENSIYFNSTFIKISTYAKDYVDRYLIHPNKNDDPRQAKH